MHTRRDQEISYRSVLDRAVPHTPGHDANHRSHINATRNLRGSGSATRSKPPWLSHSIWRARADLTAGCLTRVQQAAQIEVAEVPRSDQAARRRQGKSDPLDAYAAARAALAGEGLAVPNHCPASVADRTPRRGKARTAATNQIHALLVTAPAELRERYRRHSTTAVVKSIGPMPGPPPPATPPLSLC